MAKDSSLAPPATFFTLAGEPFPLEKLKGKKILLNFWASWCPPCAAEFPGIVELAHRSKGKFILLAVSQDNSVDEIQRFLARFPKSQALLKDDPNIHILIDKRGLVASSQFAVLRLPESFVIDASHRIARKYVGEVDWLSPEVENFLTR